MGVGSAVGDLEPTPRANDARTLVMVGKTGNGKSATGNSILGRNGFKSRLSSSGVTDKCELQSTVLMDGTCINVIDTPGLFDFSEGGTESVGKEIVRCLELAEGGIHAVLVVFSIRTRFSKEEEATLQSLKALFGSEIINYMIIIFTGGDDLEDMDETLDEYLGCECPAPLKEVINYCENRVVLFDNKTDDVKKKDVHIQQLRYFMIMVMNRNGGKPYTYRLYAELREANKLREQAKQGMDEMKDQLHKMYEEKLKELVELIETKLRVTTEMLRSQLEDERAARANAVERAENFQSKANEEISKLREDLENARRDTEELRNNSFERVHKEIHDQVREGFAMTHKAIGEGVVRAHHVTHKAIEESVARAHQVTHKAIGEGVVMAHQVTHKAIGEGVARAHQVTHKAIGEGVVRAHQVTHKAIGEGLVRAHQVTHKAIEEGVVRAHQVTHKAIGECFVRAHQEAHNRVREGFEQGQCDIM